MLVKYNTFAVVTILAFGVTGMAQAAPVYLNDSNITVALGASHGASNPFVNVSLTQSLANIIDAPSAAASEFHTQTTHVWVNGDLELDFDFGVEYDLSTLHFWNYHSEDYDVDDIAFTFYDSSFDLVGTLNAQPLLGNGDGSDSTPIFAQNYDLAFPSRVQFVNALLTGTNNRIDFNNIGFTAELSDPNGETPAIPEPATLGLLAIGFAGMGFMSLRRRRG